MKIAILMERQRAEVRSQKEENILCFLPKSLKIKDKGSKKEGKRRKRLLPFCPLPPYFFLLIFGISNICFATPSYAQPAILTVSTSQARGTNSPAIEVKVGNGRATAIDFSGVNERITQIFLADPSSFTYSTDTPLENGQSTTVFLRRIQPLKFPNLTTSSNTNLFVKTRASDGQINLYTFNLRKSNKSPNYSGIAISNQIPNFAGVEMTFQVGSFRRATINDIERGLVSAIRRGYTPPSDPVVNKVREFIALARNSSDHTFIEVASSAKVSLPLLTELALLGIEENLKNPVSMPINLPKPSREAMPNNLP